MALEKSMRVLGFIMFLLLIFCIFFTSIDLTAFNLNFYKKQYERLNIFESTGMDEENLLKATQALLDYIDGSRDNLLVRAQVYGEERQVFNQREIDHMVDVRDLFALGFRLRKIFFGVFLAILILLIIFLKGKAPRSLGLSYLFALLALAVMGMILFGFMLYDFTALWNGFHRVFFTNDLWILNPDRDIMIRMFPEDFFYRMVLRIMGVFGVTLAGLAILALVILHKTPPSGRKAKA